ncbi:MAG TPA: hypothetical protein VJP59_08370 [Gemmatimonadota bacterium]|nr:hypothetical protein [Gemmatimonadota bacterium]
MSPRSTATGYAASPSPAAAIETGESGREESRTSPLTGLVSWVK